MDLATRLDVLVVGDGIAGCTAAITAHEAGAKVLIVDKAPADVPHGNTAFSGGNLRRISEQYPAERFYDDMLRVSDNRADPEVARIIVENSAKVCDWLATLGVPWITIARTAAFANRADGRGFGLAAALRRAVRTHSIPILNEVEALKLLQENGRIVGVRVREKSGEEQDIRAAAVVIATGGFSANPEMVKKYIGPGATNLVLRGFIFDTGDGLRMAEAVGAKLDWMNDFHGGLIHYGYRKYPQEGATKGMRSVKLYEACVLINKDGRRFIDEGENTADKTYAKFGKIIALTQPDGIAYAVGDFKVTRSNRRYLLGAQKEPAEAETLEELAALIEVSVSAFVATIAEFNANVTDSKAPGLTPPKSNFAQRIDTAPFYAYKLTGGFTFTFGGLTTKRTGEVLDVHKQVIPGLYAVGEIVTGVFFGNYAAGSSLTRCAIFGRIVGFEAAHYAWPNLTISCDLWSTDAP